MHAPPIQPLATLYNHAHTAVFPFASLLLSSVKVNRHYAIAAAGLALLCILLLWKRGGDDPTMPERTNAEPRKAVTALTAVGSPSALTRRTAVIEPAEPPEREFNPYEEWDTLKVLEQFMVPPGEFRGKTMADAVSAFAELFAQHGGRKVEFFYDAAALATGYPLEFEYGNISMRSLMELTAGLAGFEMEMAEGSVSFTPIPPSADDNTLLTLAFDVPTGFTGDLARDLNRGNPFVENPGEAMASLKDFANWGIYLDDDVGKVIHDPKNNSLAVELTPPELARAEAVVNHLVNGGSTTQIVLSQKLITTEGGLHFDPQTYANDAAYQIAIRAMEQREGVDVLSSPTVVTRPGQRAMVEIGREVAYLTEAADGGPAHVQKRMVGTKLPITPILTGLDRVQLEGAAEFTTLGNQTLKATIGTSPDGRPEPLAGDPNSFRTHTTDFSGDLFDGNTATVHAAEENGVSVYQFITARRINPDGTPLLPDAVGASVNE